MLIRKPDKYVVGTPRMFPEVVSPPTQFPQESAPNITQTQGSFKSSEMAQSSAALHPFATSMLMK